MVVARNWRRRRSLAVSSSSPTSFMLPPEGTSAPFCNNPMIVSDVTDFPEPLSPTRQSVSRSRTCSETPSTTRGLFGSLPRPTTRLSMSRIGLVVMLVSLLRHCEPTGRRKAPPDDRLRKAIHRTTRKNGLLRRFAPRKDVVRASFPLPLLHARIERVARGVADQIDGKDRDRQQQSRP